MGRGPFGCTPDQLRHLFEGRSVAGVSEYQLLHRYLERRDEVAFEAIVSRHGPMVLGVCRRVLAEASDVEDAFQATFTILARKGGTLGEGDPIGHWLCGVAYRVALRARASAARRRRLEGAARPAGGVGLDDPSRGELAAVIDEELHKLPAKYRAPVVLCYLEGVTHEEAARQLGWPLGSVKGRLGRARDLLRGRLARRGVAPSGLFALARGGLVPIPKTLLELTTRAATAGRASGMVPAAVSSLVAGSLTSMMLNKLKVVGITLLVLGTGAAALAYQASKGAGRAQGEDQARVLMAKAVQPPARVTTSPGDVVADWVAGWPELTDKPDDNPKNQVILKKLEEPVAMNFGSDTPLEDVKKYIQEATKDEGGGLPLGIPIYVDPQGLQDSDKTMASTVVITLEGIPLKTTLRLLLKQLSLMYQVRDGLLIITSTSEEDQVTPFSLMGEKPRKGELTREQYKQLIEALKLKGEVEALLKEQAKAGGFQ